MTTTNKRLEEYRAREINMIEHLADYQEQLRKSEAKVKRLSAKLEKIWKEAGY
jgi:chromosome segregation ATPase